MNDINSINTQIRLQKEQKPPQNVQRAAGLNEGDVANGARAGQREPSAEQTQKLASELNKALEQVDGNYSVSVDDESGMVIVRITDTETGDIVKQIPPQQVLDANVSVEKIIGLLVNDQA